MALQCMQSTAGCGSHCESCITRYNELGQSQAVSGCMESWWHEVDV